MPMHCCCSFCKLYERSSCFCVGSLPTFICFLRLAHSFFYFLCSFHQHFFVKELLFLLGSDDKEGRTRWMSESGVIDIFFFMGPTPLDIFRQYGKVTGVTPLPQQFA